MWEIEGEQRMKIFILVENQYVDLARSIARQHLDLGPALLKSRASQSGQAPNTHWYCYFEASTKVIDKILELQTHAIVETDISLEDALKKYNLKRIPNDR